jgi:hypothetical protein
VIQNRRSLNWAPALLLAAPFACTADAAIVAKQLAGGPEEFAAMAPANPIESATHSKSALLPVTLEKRANGQYGWQSPISVEGSNLRFLVLSGDQTWNVNLQDPISKRMQPAEQLAISKRRANYGISDNGVPADSYTFENVARGEWNLAIDAKAGGRGFVLIEGEGGERLMSHQARMNQRVGQRIGLVASVYNLDESAGNLRGDALSIAKLRVTAPNGSVNEYAMFDDGLHEDGIASDGVFGADFLASHAGNFNAQVVIQGTSSNGQRFVRTSEHLIPVIDEQLTLASLQSKATQTSANRFNVRIPVTAAKSSGHYRSYAQVWGTRGGSMVPVAWIGGMSDVKGGGLELGLDARWIAKAGAQAPFEIRDLRIEDPDHFITVAAASRMALNMGSLPKAASTPVTGVSEEMRVGPRPAQTLAKGVGSRLLLVHGYCSGNVWGGVAGQFSNASVFQDFNQNRSHDAFARLIQTYGNTWNSFGIVAHSQGGAASLHLYNYYWSGLDNAVGSRLIQSVGTPYRGTALAGNAAALGNVFGVGCGTNSNLTYSGASSWLAGISTASRAKANYFTTSFTDRAWLYDYCNVVTDVLLSDPEDGTTEQSYGQLPSGVNRGHKTGWCHTSGMRDPAQATDSSRNSTMNSNAAR